MRLLSCSRCGEIKDEEQFYHRRTEGTRGRYSQCISCRRIVAADPGLRKDRKLWAKRYHLNNIEARWASRIWRDYKVTPDKYQEMLDRQGGGCGICARTTPGGNGPRFPIDHDHACCPGLKSCGECVRGLLCVACNNRLGVAEGWATINAVGILEYLANAKATRTSVH